MADKVVLHYLNGRGKMESIRWLLAVAKVEFDEVFITTREQYLKLVNDGDLLFQQVPMVEIDGMKLVQRRAIFYYIAQKYGLHGQDIKERAMINQYTEGLIDLMEMIIMLLFAPDKQAKLMNIETKAKERYLPVFEEVLKNHIYLVGGKMSMADVLLLECTLMLEELFTGILGDFRNIKSFQGRMTMVEGVKRFLGPDGKRKPPHDDNFLKTVKEVFNM